MAHINHVLEQRGIRVHEVIGKHHSEGSITDVLTGLQNSMSQTQRVSLAHRVHARKLEVFTGEGKKLVLACLLELIFKTGIGIEVGFDGFLAGSSHEEHIVDTGIRCLSSDIFD